MLCFLLSVTFFGGEENKIQSMKFSSLCIVISGWLLNVGALSMADLLFVCPVVLISVISCAVNCLSSGLQCVCSYHCQSVLVFLYLSLPVSPQADFFMSTLSLMCLFPFSMRVVLKPEKWVVYLRGVS